MKKFFAYVMILNVKKTILMAVGVSQCVVKKVASANAAFFVPKLLQEREQHQNSLDKVQHEIEPLEFVHDITPSLARGSRFTNCHKNYITFQKSFNKKFSPQVELRSSKIIA